MVTLLLAYLVLLAALAIAVYLRRKTVGKGNEQLHVSGAAPRVTSLFDYRIAKPSTAPPPLDELKARARAGDQRALFDARLTKPDTVYKETLKTLIESCSTDQEFFKLVSFVARDEDLLVTQELATGFIERWKQNSNQVLVGEMLHVTALSNDAALYRSACELVVDSFLHGKLPRVKVVDLSTLIEGEYWILSTDARASGAGFVLKQSIAEFRKQLVSRINQ